MCYDCYLSGLVSSSAFPDILINTILDIAYHVKFLLFMKEFSIRTSSHKQMHMLTVIIHNSIVFHNKQFKLYLFAVRPSLVGRQNINTNL